MNHTAQINELKNRRRFVRAIVVVGILASIGANVLDEHEWAARLVVGWPPVALLLALEVLTRVPTSKRLGAFGRVMATIGVAFAAAWLSYWHMASTVSQHGEHGTSAYVWPISVDGLMTISAIALVELGARIRELETARTPHAPAPVSPGMAPVAAPSTRQVEQVVEDDNPLAVQFRQRFHGGKRKQPVAA